MLDSMDVMRCDVCHEVIEDDKAIFIDAEDGGGEFCSWECAVAYAEVLILSNPMSKPKKR